MFYCIRNALHRSVCTWNTVDNMQALHMHLMAKGMPTMDPHKHDKLSYSLIYIKGLRMLRVQTHTQSCNTQL